MNGGFSDRAMLTRRARGQSLVEFAVVIPIFLLIFGAVVQFGLIFWAQTTLSQVVRDTGRWAATVQTSPCDSSTAKAAVVTQADRIARTSSLLAYRSGQWSGGGSAYDPVTPRPREGVELRWASPDLALFNTDCPPDSNATVFFVTIRASHVVPSFFPAIGAFIPDCASDGCSLSATAEFRMEPAP